MNHLRCRRTLGAGLVALLAAAYQPSPAGADAVDVFEVKDVAVDVTAATAAEAREDALVQGEITAFQRLLERLTLRGHRDKLPELPKSDIDIYVQDFSVADEKASSVRYLARLNFRFKAEEVRRLLHDFGIPFAETVSKPVLVMPVFQDAGALILWDDPNPWREAWLNRPPTHGLVPTMLPVGDLADMAAIGAEQAMDGDMQRLNAVAARYGASDALVVFGVLRFDAANNRRALEVYFTRYGTQLREQTEVMTFTQEKIETVPQLLLRAARELTQIVEDNWKRDNLLQLARSGVVAAVVPITGLRDWLAVRKRLQQVAVVRRAEMVLLSQDEVRVNLHFLGDPGQLALALEQADLRLFEESGEWLLTLLEPPPGPPPGSPPGPTTKGAPTAPIAAGRPPGKS
ncbi:MAG: DUF2066 domain-containing protein [Rhodospirillales bacterium]|nr:DUF2066 domain-containing protein [Rhodospirillales bacterium]